MTYYEVAQLEKIEKEWKDGEKTTHVDMLRGTIIPQKTLTEATKTKILAYATGTTTSESPIDLLTQEDTGEQAFREQFRQLSLQEQNEDTAALREALFRNRDAINMVWMYGSWKIQKLVEEQSAQGENRRIPGENYRPQQTQQRRYMDGVRRMYEKEGLLLQPPTALYQVHLSDSANNSMREYEQWWINTWRSLQTAPSAGGGMVHEQSRKVQLIYISEKQHNELMQTEDPQSKDMPGLTEAHQTKRKQDDRGEDTTKSETASTTLPEGEHHKHKKG